MAELEENFKSSGGVFREYKIGELFEINSSKKIYHANRIKNIYDSRVENSYPYVVRSTNNNGIRGYICQDEKFLNPGNTLSFAQDTFTVFYQAEPYFTGNKVKILVPNFIANRINLTYLSACFQKALNEFTWGIGSTVESIKNDKIILPCEPSGDIAFDYMESYVKELEALRLKELEAYLIASGLKDYELDLKDKAALAKFDDLTNGGGGVIAA